MTTVGIIGTGWGARVQAPMFREAGLEIGGIAGFHANKTAKLAEELRIRPFKEWRELVASSAIDLVTITTPPSEHLQMARAALEAGKHVICEKPMALNGDEARELVAAADQHGDRIALIDHELRYLPAFRAARDRVKSIGALRYIEIRYASPGRGDRGRPWNWWSDAARGGGAWGAVGSHFVDTIRYAGFEVEQAQAMLATIVAERPFEGERRRVTSDDFAAVHLRLRNGAVATLTISAVASGPDEASVITFHGEEGALRLTGEELLMAKRGESFTRVAGNDMQNRPGNSPGGAFGTGTLLLGQALRAALDEGDRKALAPAATFRDGLAHQLVLDAARRSSQRGSGWEPVG